MTLKGSKMGRSGEGGDYWWTEQAMEQALTEHPGELVRTGSPYFRKENTIFSLSSIFIQKSIPIAI